MKVKAIIRETAADEFEAMIYVGCMWRVFATPYKKAKGSVSLFANKKTAKNAAEKVAGALGIKLIWEDK